MGAVVAVGGVANVAAGIADAGRKHAGHFADQVLHAPKATSGKNGPLGFLGHFGSPGSSTGSIWGQGRPGSTDISKLPPSYNGLRSPSAVRFQAFRCTVGIPGSKSRAASTHFATRSMRWSLR